MYNWNTDTRELKNNPEKYTIWKLEQLINYGLDGEKLQEKDVVKYWEKLRIDSRKRSALAFLLWHKRS